MSLGVILILALFLCRWSGFSGSSYNSYRVHWSSHGLAPFDENLPLNSWFAGIATVWPGNCNSGSVTFLVWPHPPVIPGVFFPVWSAGPELPLRRLQSESTIPSGRHLSLESPLPGMKNRSPVVLKLVQNVDNPFVEQALNLTQVYKRLNYGGHKRFNDFKLLVTAYYNSTIWSLL